MTIEMRRAVHRGTARLVIGMLASETLIAVDTTERTALTGLLASC